jgi:TRAP-type uncharacterized transport system fused permease subunit
MTLTSLVPAIAAILFILFALYVAFNDNALYMQKIWRLPAAISLLFLLFSLLAIATEDLTRFWIDHMRDLWGNQIWLDLLLAVSIGWFLVVPQAKVLKMPLLPWLFLISCTGCIGFLAMIARVLYLRENGHFSNS